MWITTVIVAFAVFVGWKEIPRIYARNSTRELLVFSILLAIGVGLCIVQFALRLSIPSPLNVITYVFEPINKVMAALLN